MGHGAPAARLWRHDWGGRVRPAIPERQTRVLVDLRPGLLVRQVVLWCPVVAILSGRSVVPGFASLSRGYIAGLGHEKGRSPGDG